MWKKVNFPVYGERTKKATVKVTETFLLALLLVDSELPGHSDFPGLENEPLALQYYK